MRCIIIDDEPLAREGIKLHIDEINWLNLVGSFNNVIDADEFLKANPVDLIFLDIQMPKISGIEYLKTFKPNTQVILTTANRDYALEGFELGVVDYLLKPITFERFYKAVSKLRSSLATSETKTDDYLFIKTEGRLIKTEYKNILYIESLKDYVSVFCKEGKYVVSTNLKQIHNQLPQNDFIRINREQVINLAAATSIDRDYIIIDKLKFNISDIYKEELNEALAKKKILKR